MGDIKTILFNSSSSIDKTTQLFYQQNVHEGYISLDQTLNLLTQAIDSIISYKAEGKDLAIDAEDLLKSLTEALKALEEKDTTLLSDILTYEVKELIDKVLPTL